MKAVDNGSGLLLSGGVSVAASAVNYTSRTIVFKPDAISVGVPKPKFEKQILGVINDGLMRLPSGVTGFGTTTTTNSRLQFTGFETIQYPTYWPDSAVTVRWRSASGSTAATETFQVDELEYDLTPGFAETILQGSARFRVGNLTYIDRAGALYHTVNASTGAATPAGELQYSTGLIKLSEWQAGAANTLALDSLVTETNVNPVDEVTFRVPIIPVRPGSFQVRCIPIAGTAQVQVTADPQGRIVSSQMVGTIDFLTGVVRIKFGYPVEVTPAIQAKAWFNAAAVFDDNGTAKIYEPKPVYADSIRYNAVGFSYLPLNASILGLDPVRLPSDGRVPIFRVGDVAVVHHTDKTAFPGTPAVATALNVGRVRLSRMRIVDSVGTVANPLMFDIDLDAGTVLLKANYSQGTLLPPLYAEHRIEDEAVITDVQINGLMALNIPITHNFPASTTVVSSALLIGNLLARAVGKFSQKTWANVWSDVRIGDNTLAQYNDTIYPISVSNRGAIQERWALIFTSSSAFRVIGENVGQIATGDINTDLAPGNPGFGEPYFSINKLGWGTGWASGDVLRFNTAAANFPVNVARTVLQGPSTALNDQFGIEVRGDIDRP
jgi:hypothetical protein